MQFATVNFLFANLKSLCDGACQNVNFPNPVPMQFITN